MLTMSEDAERQIERLSQQVHQLYQEGRYEEAIDIATQACDLTRQHLGEEHPDFATSLNNLGLLYDSMGKYEAAESLIRQALEIIRRSLGEEHPYFATSLDNLAQLYRGMVNYEAAEPLYRQALGVRIRVSRHQKVTTSGSSVLPFITNRAGDSNARTIFKARLTSHGPGSRSGNPKPQSCL